MQSGQPPAPMSNGIDDKTVALLREEIKQMRASMVTRESYELLQREVKATKDTLENYKKDSNKKIIDLMKEVS